MQNAYNGLRHMLSRVDDWRSFFCKRERHAECQLPQCECGCHREPQTVAPLQQP